MNLWQCNANSRLPQYTAADLASLRELADDASRRYGPRGLNFALKQGVLGAGAGTNLWVEVQVVPMVLKAALVPALACAW